MSDENGLKWLVEEREKWKRRAEWAEAELVRRDAELEPGAGASVRRLVDSKAPRVEATFEPIAVDRYGDEQ